MTTADDVGGMQRVVAGLARALPQQGWSVKSVFPQSPKSAALLDWCRDQKAIAETSSALLDVAAPHGFSDMLALRNYVHMTRPDVVNLHYGDNFMSLKDVLAVRLAGRHRCVVTVHHPTHWNNANKRKRHMTVVAAQLAHAVIAVSHATHQVLLDAGIPAHKLHVIPSGLRVPEHLPSRAEGRARLGLPLDAFVIGSLARLVPHKGIGDLIEAAARVPDPETKLVVAIAGDGPERQTLEQRAATLLGERAVFLGHVPDTADLYAAANVFALPSYLEGFGLVYIEAAFHGIPSIGTNVGGIPDAIVDGETGVLVSAGDTAALTVAIQKLRDDPALRFRLGAAARTRAHAEFTEQRMAERYIRVMQP